MTRSRNVCHLSFIISGCLFIIVFGGYEFITGKLGSIFLNTSIIVPVIW
jgi:hypothetical protein